MRFVVEVGGKLQAYALYRIRESEEEGWMSTSTLEVQEAAGASPQGPAELWRYLLDLDLMHTVVAELLPVDDPLKLLPVDARRMRSYPTEDTSSRSTLATSLALDAGDRASVYLGGFTFADLFPGRPRRGAR